MIRRKFLQLVALSSAGGLAPFAVLSRKAATADASTNAKTSVFEIKGFSCITCAVGLDTMFSRTKGILSSHSTYPEGKVIVQFDPDSILEIAVRTIITDAGFTITSELTA